MSYEEPSLTVLGPASEMIQGAGIHKTAFVQDGNGDGNDTSSGAFYDMDE